jgi:hypothetical protein
MDNFVNNIFIIVFQYDSAFIILKKTPQKNDSAAL